MLGVFFSSRSPILGIPIGIFFIGMLFSGLFKPLMYTGPSMLTGFAEVVAGSVPVPPGLLWPPLLATGLWCVAFTCAALFKFEHTEF